MRIVTLAIGITVASAGCTPEVEVKLDTPEATVATLIKLYGAGDKKGRVEQLVDRQLMKMDARRVVCLDAALAEGKCTSASTEAVLSGRSAYGYRPPECEHIMKYRDCTCGETGSAAANNQYLHFAGSNFDKGLTLAHLSPGACKITERVELDKEKIENLVHDFPALACEPAPAQPDERHTFGAKGAQNSIDPNIAKQAALREAAEFGMIGLMSGDGSGAPASQSPPVAAVPKMTSVTFTCGSNSMTAILRNNASGWYIVAFADETARSLSIDAFSASLEQGKKQHQAEQEKREGDLNKDLK